MELNIPTQSLNCHNFIDGQWIKASGQEFLIKSPYTDKIIGKSWVSEKEDIDNAINHAEEGFIQWNQTPLKERTQIMFRFRQILDNNLNELSHLVASESGKTWGEAKAGLLKGIEVLEFALSLQNNLVGGKMEVSRGVHCEYRQVPRGVVLGITPFNFPAMVPMWMIPIALTLGNSFVWKPSDKTPLTSIKIAEALQEAGLPDGVLTVLHGDKSTVETLIDHPGIKAIGFVGSTQVAQAVYRRGAQNLKPVLALGGAKNHIILMPDADPKLTHKGISDSFTGCGGQRCMAASTLLTVGNCDALIKGITSVAQQTRLGKTMGAIISKEAKNRLEEAISKAVKDGAKILLDGRNSQIPKEYEGGYWLGPTILDQVHPESQAGRDELFGPILSIIRCQTIDQALNIENSNPYGNACSIFTQNGGAAEYVAQRAHAGMLGVNIGVPVPREPFSFGGICDSKFGVGDITGINSINLWSHSIKLTTKWADQKDSNWMS